MIQKFPSKSDVVHNFFIAFQQKKRSLVCNKLIIIIQKQEEKISKELIAYKSNQIIYAKKNYDDFNPMNFFACSNSNPGLTHHFTYIRVLLHISK